MFWLICTMMTLCVAAYLATPLLRGQTDDAQSSDMTIYKGQLAEVDRDVERGVLAPEDAERAKTEISRRLLAASRTVRRSGTAPVAVNRGLAIATLVLLAVLGGWIYMSVGAPGAADQPLSLRLAIADEIRATRPSQDALEAAAPPGIPPDVPEDYTAQIEQLRVIVPTRPDDLEGWTLLAYHEAQLRNFGDAARAQARVVDLKGNTVETADLVQLADLLVIAADGIISPEAENVTRLILDRDPNNVPGRYFMGALYGQTGRPDIAFRMWRPLVESGAQGFHVDMARSQIEDAAFRAGVEYVLPETGGPTAAEIAAATDMTDEDRNAMIGGMVNRLAERLGSQGGSAADWARLIAAYGVLGETESAAGVWAEAQRVFADDTAAIDALRTAAQTAGVAE
ncbi:c-type cytochrome biogenesis protein CcmI [Loktanella sp. SALINAS62]|uniref:c-type cytochrome biogenesis protein CcmI n=1 Tax=Loktanella sp. SALINAS62 TaxID=2706124 RepID=UPI001B8AE2E3|nr:c-type cytochrome biogenesis protein CcmI [Loktanella sp. SALINAS62]MBS1303552.1 c-type cytochrome biogenesis protein CcmI [Loktanella sp. SALINAS62]